MEAGRCGSHMTRLLRNTHMKPVKYEGVDEGTEFCINSLLKINLHCDSTISTIFLEICPVPTWNIVQ